MVLVTRREAPNPFSAGRVQINVELDREQRDDLRESAKARERSFAAEVRTAIRYYLEREWK